MRRTLKRQQEWSVIGYLMFNYRTEPRVKSQCPTFLLFLRPHPSLERLKLVGAQFRLDPEYFRRLFDAFYNHECPDAKCIYT
jgi:hypothetical protein